MKVLKFGGSSLASAEKIRGVVSIIEDGLNDGAAAVVVSAMGGVTDDLLAATEAAAGDENYRDVVERIRFRHETAADELLSTTERENIRPLVDGIFVEMNKVLHGASLVGECTPRTRDAVLCCGERLSAQLVAAALRCSGTPADFCDARTLIVTDDQFGNARVDMAATRDRVVARVADRPSTQVITGFIAANRRGETTTLGRGGSDYTAAILGAALDVESVEIWTDVDGVMSADPRLVPGAFSLPALSYDELMELSHFGAKVVYPPTLHPARTHSIPIVIRNTFNPSFAGTRVLERVHGNGHQVRGISSVDEVALLRLEGDGMVGVPGIAKRLFGVLARRNISIVLISQASSEHSICFAVAPQAVEDAQQQVDSEFKLERGAGLVDPVVVETGLSVIAVVGETMCRIPGIAGKVFSVLGDHGINVRAIAQGSSELNISLVVARRDQAAAVIAIHDAFFPRISRVTSVRERIPTAVLGATGSVGQRMISLLADHPWFVLVEAAASERSAGRLYGDTVRWFQNTPIPPSAGGLEILPIDADLKAPLVLSALDSDVAGEVEERYARAGHLVVSNAKNHRMRGDVPLLIPEVNPDHLELVASQPYGGGAIVTNPNCSTIGLVLALKPLHDAFGIDTVNVVTMQAISGAGYPGVSSLEIVDNLVPFIGGEEEKLETETRKILGRLEGGGITDAEITVSAQCNRVAVIDGHTECVSVKLHNPATLDEIIEVWEGFRAAPQWLHLPSAPSQPIHYNPADAAPQPRLHRDAEAGMAITIGRLRPCALFDYKFVCLSHNTIRGAAGGSLLAAEMAVSKRVVPSIAPPPALKASP
jgi:aspartate-semialdehyde dehydrogenase